MQCVILAGGLGTRMASFTSNKIPKCLIKINNIPFIDYQLQWLSKQGIKDIVLCISYLGQMVRDYVQDGSKWGLSVEYVEDGDVPLGTGGALRKALDEGKLQDSFFILYGDSFLPINLINIFEYYQQQSLSALMTIYYNNNKLDQSNVIFDNNIIFYDKSCSLKPQIDFTFIDYGLSILSHDIIKNNILPNQKYDLATLFNILSIKKQLAGYIVNERFFEIGSPLGLEDFKNWINNETKINFCNSR